jgi:periplasmic protein TonB
MNKIQNSLIAAALMLAPCAFAELRISGADALKNATSRVQPAYSPVARQMKVAGKVEVEAQVDESGNVGAVKALNGNPLLTQSAIAAVQKWKFEPFTEAGKPAAAVVTLSFEFKP